MIFLKIFQEGIVLALQELWGNKLRTFLSLSGITIGIFCVIAVFSVIDSFEAGLKKSFNKVGSNILHLTKESWDIQKVTTEWWKYMSRPFPSYEEFKMLKDKLNYADAVSIRAFVGGQQLRHNDQSIENGFLLGITYDFGRIFDTEFAHGRYFTQQEIESGQNMIIVGYEVATKLFTKAELAVGKQIKHQGRKLSIIGVIQKEGESLLGDGFDEATIVPYNYFRKYFNVKDRNMGSIIDVRVVEDMELDEVREEIRGIIRAKRRLKPKEADNFEINHLSLLTGLIDKVFGVVTIAGFLIGLFAILVGAFGIANIMFVSVKERTRFIGIKKSLGAKRIYILLEFLVESVILTILGGLLGLGVVYLLLQLGNTFIDSFDLFLSTNNIIVGLSISIIVGLIAGIIPAISASRMDPVEAMRS